MRYRENKPEDLKRARTAVAARRGRIRGEQLNSSSRTCAASSTAIYGVVLRAVLFAVDSHAAKATTGVPTAGAVR